MLKRVMLCCVGALLLTSPALAERLAIDETAKGELADKNRFSLRGIVMDSIAGAGLEYERALVILDYGKPAIATSINTGYQGKSDIGKQVKFAEYGSFADVTLRYIVMPFTFAQFFFAGGATFYSTTIKLSDMPGTGRNVEGAGNFAGMQLLGEIGIRLTIGAVSLGVNLSATRIPPQNINFTYQSGAFQLPDSVSYAPLANSRLHFFIGYLF